MKVYFFHVRPQSGIDLSPDFLADLGDNIPHPQALEGEGAQYILCISREPVELAQICEKHNIYVSGLIENTPMFRRHAFEEYDIDPEKYNNRHYVHICYFQKERYELTASRY